MDKQAAVDAPTPAINTVVSCNTCPYAYRFGDGFPGRHRCIHPDVTRDYMPGPHIQIQDVEVDPPPPKWCPLRTGPITVRLVRPAAPAPEDKPSPEA